ncbi:MAG: endonuclease/exonuclease/phosphatase family protein [Deltaproteobacteria bacterium]|nr:endonuclease/exonuclease/phosphatase family protein [Deltaproteobacteria bacterium]
MKPRTFIKAVRRALGPPDPVRRSAAFEVVRHPSAAPTAPSLRLMSFNIQGGHVAPPEALADFVGDHAPDVLALQEVDRGVPRSGGAHQARVMAERLGMSFAFAGTLRVEGGDYGIALLSRWPLLQVARHDLVVPYTSEPRAVIEARVQGPTGPLHVLATHADFLPWSAAAHGRALARRAAPLSGQRLVVMGDLNAGPGMAGPRAMVQAGLHDAVGGFDDGPTFVDPPRLRVDYILLDPPLAAGLQGGRRIMEVMSDHYPVVADVDLT